MVLPLLLVASLLAADPAVPPASEAAIDAFIAALPPAEAEADPGEAFDKDRLERLIDLNPGRKEDVRSVFEANERCERQAKDQAVADGLRASARRLGDEQLQRLTQFYSGPDFQLFSRLSKQPENELSEAEAAALKRILAAYPIEQYFLSMRETEKDMWSPDGLAGALLQCFEAYEQELVRRGLKR